jgi:hypothetical protein
VLSTDTTFRQLESPIPQGSQVVNVSSGGVAIGTKVDLSNGPVRTLDSSYVQGIVIYNEDLGATDFIYVAGIEYAGKLVGAPDNAGLTAFKILPGEALAIDCRDASGICIAFSAAGKTARILGN